MNRSFRFLIAVLVVSLAPACGGAHLSSDTGRAYHAALAAQRESAAKPIPPMTARDARRVMRAHNGGAGASGSPPTGGVPAAPSINLGGLSSGGASGGLWQGASGGIRLEAK